MFKKIIKNFISLIMIMMRVFPIKSNKVLFSAFSARCYGDNPKYIAEYILNNSLDYECVFVLRDLNQDVPKGIRVVKYNSFKYLYELVTSKFWIDNTRKQSFVIKRKGQIYIQTWHGSILLKKIEKDAQENLDFSYVQQAKKDSKNIDYLLVSSEWGKEKFKKCFWYNGKIEITGSPRVDLLFDVNDNLKRNILKKLNISSDKKILLYAPTFRKDFSNKAYSIDYTKVIEKLKEKTGKDWIILVKLHPNISDLNLVKDTRILDVTKYPDITELYIIADMLITDYSSTMFDFSLTRKLVLLYCPDIKEYINERDFSLDLYKLPYKISTNNEELIELINDYNISEYEKRVNEFYKKLGIIEDGNASKRVIELMDKEKNEKRI